MDTEQPVTDSDIGSRLSNFFSPEPEAAAEVETDAPVSEQIEPEIQSESDDEQPSEQEDSSYVEIDLGDGEVVKGSEKLKQLVEAGKGFTPKTQELAQQRKAVDDKAQYLEAREVLSKALENEVGELKALEMELKKFESVDWAALYDANLGQAVQLRDRRDQLRQEMASKQQAIAQKAQQGQQILTQHAEKQWSLAVEGVKQRLGKVTPEEDIAMLQQVHALGFDQQEVKTKLADSRILQAIYKAAKWDALQAGKPVALKTAAKAPPVIKPGSNTQNTATAKDKSVRERLRKSGDYKDAARLLMSRIK
jgi:hypothetical protein